MCGNITVRFRKRTGKKKKHGKERKGLQAYFSVVGWSIAAAAESLVTMGFKSVPFLRFFPPLPLAAEAATLAICFPLLKTAFVMSTLSIVFFSMGWVAWRGEWERAGERVSLRERGKRRER